MGRRRVRGETGGDGQVWGSLTLTEGRGTGGDGQVLPTM